MKSIVYPAVAISILLLLGLLAFISGRSEEPLAEPSLEVAPTIGFLPPERSTPRPQVGISPTPIGTNSHSPGSLRVSNQTEHPVRLALLAKPPGNNAAKASSAKLGNSAYRDPAHWDFAPQEGSNQGLLLSLPAGNLKLNKGDILIAFAQDGSRKYWGPYVVGETDLPVWNSQTAEWQLTLQRN